ncbi:MAG: tetratricopeptide repeat protein [Rhodospirillaceae bacterium]|nr:tetratricopeptide repeat protein [Rhodospirillaceae bacterium]
MSSRANLNRRPVLPAAHGAARSAGPAAELQRGVALHLAGDLDGAEAAYKRVLRRLPRQPDALHLLGVVRHQRGDSARAVELISNALRIDDSNPHARLNLGAALLGLGRLDEAEKALDLAAARLPDNPDLLANRSTLLQRRGELPQAIAALEQAVALAPGRAGWRLRLADLLLDAGRHEDAVAAYEAYLVLAPDDVTARNNLGVALEKAGRHAAAAAQFRMVIERRPELAEAHANLGNACLGLRLFDEAEAHYRRAIALDPGQWRFRVNLANLLLDGGRAEEAQAVCEAGMAQQADDAALLNELGVRLVKAKREEEAVTVLRRAIALAPEFAGAHNNLGNALANLKRFDEAEAAFQEAIRLDPDFLLPRLNLCGLLQKTHRWDEAVMHAYGMRLCRGFSPELCDNRILQVFKDVIDFDSVESMTHFWDLVERQSREERAAAALTLLAMADDEAKLRRLSALVRRMGTEFGREARERPLGPAPRRPPLAGRRLRLGILSSDLRVHSVSKFLLPVLRHYDRDRFEIVCYSAYPEVNDAVQAEIRTLVDGFRTVCSLSDREIAQQIRDDGIDVLLELNGYTMHSRLPVVTYRPAPVQVAWLGWPFTSGMTEMDYFLVDRFTRPTCDDHLVEAPLEMDGAFVCFEGFPDEPLAPPPFLANGHLTFGTLNAVYKWSRPMIARWCEVMRAVEGSRMVIVRPEARSVIFLNNLVREFERHGIARDRLDVINNHLGTASHLSYYNLFDISLDTFPVTGGTTTTDALWMGVPVVTVMGAAYHQRIGGAIAMHAGLADLCVATPEEFVRTAVSLAGNRDRLVELRGSLRDRLRETPLCRVDSFMAGFEKAILAAARRHLD